MRTIKTERGTWVVDDKPRQKDREGEWIPYLRINYQSHAKFGSEYKTARFLYHEGEVMVTTHGTVVFPPEILGLILSYDIEGTQKDGN